MILIIKKCKNIKFLERSGLGKELDIYINFNQVMKETKFVSAKKKSFLSEVSIEDFHGSEKTYKLLVNNYN